MTAHPPPTLPEEIPPPPTPGKYLRPRRYISWIGVVLGLGLGLAGGLFYAWNINPIVEIATEPWQLGADDRAQYIVAITLSYAHDGNLNRAIQRLLELRLKGDPIHQVAEAACDLARTGFVDSSSGLRAIHTMMQFYQLQGRAGCADTLIPVDETRPTAVVQIVLPTPTLPPPPSKTPTLDAPGRPTAPAQLAVVPTSPPQRDFAIANINTFCDTELSGLIEAHVQDASGNGIPGHLLRVRWDDGEDTFMTGLKPERGPAYADFQMEDGKGYTIELPGLSEPSTQPLTAIPCTTASGQRSITSYRVVFRPAN